MSPRATPVPRSVVKAGWSPRKRVIAAVLGVSVAALGTTLGFVLAAPLDVEEISFGLGTSELPPCLTESEVSFEFDVSETNVTTISAVEVTGIATQCDGLFLVLALRGTGGLLLDEIVWALDTAAGATSITAVADGTTGATTVVSGAARVLPSSQVDPEGLAMGIESSDVLDISLEILPTSRSAQE